MRFLNIPFQKYEKWFVLFFTLLATVIVAGYLLLSIYTYAKIDDYNVAAAVRNLGVIPFVMHYFQSWGGRYSYAIIQAFMSLPGVFPDHVNVLLFACDLLLVFSLLLFLTALNKGFSPLFIMDTAFLLLLLPEDTKRETLYWLDGNSTYLLPVAFGLLLASFILHVRPQKMPGVITCYLGAIFIAGFNEQFTGMSLFVITVLLLWPGFKRATRAYEPAMLACLSGFSAGACILLLAPGSYVRRAIFKPRSLFKDPSYFVHEMIGHCWRSSMHFILPCIAYGLIRFALKPGGAINGFKGNALAASVLYVATIIIGFFIVVYGFANSGSLPSRVLLVIYFWMAGGLVIMIHRLLSLIPTHFLYKRPAKFMIGFLAIALLYHPSLPHIKSLVFSLQKSPEQHQRAMAMVEQLRAASLCGFSLQTVVDIPYPQSIIYLGMLSNNPYSWLNIGIGQYYGIKKIVMP